MHHYGLHLGMAFQICDDALDYEANPADMGKNAGDDFHEGKVTLPAFLPGKKQMTPSEPSGNAH